MTHSSWPSCSKVKYEKKSWLECTWDQKHTHTLSTCAAHTWVEMSSYWCQNMSSLTEMLQQTVSPFPLIKSGTSEKWVFCVGNKIPPITQPTQSTWETTVKTHLLSISWELLLIRQHKVTGNDFFWYNAKCWHAWSIKKKENFAIANVAVWDDNWLKSE